MTKGSTRKRRGIRYRLAERHPIIGYLVDQYGEQAVIAYICSDNEYNAEWDKSYRDLVQDWRTYIQDNYSQYSRNEAQ